MKRLLSFFVFTFCMLFLFSCASLQEDMILSSDSSVQDEELKNIESLLVQLDVKTFEGQIVSTTKAKELALQVESSLADVELKNAQKARLLAILGRLSLLQGKKTHAKSYYEESISTYKGEVQAVVLANRLGLVESIDSEIALAFAPEDKALLILEKALQCYSNKEYRASVTAFDEAFISLPSYYKETYKTLRDRSWQLRGIESVSTDEDVAELALETTITVPQMLFLTQNASSELLPYTGGNIYSQRELFNLLSRAGLLTSVSGEQILAEESLVTRIIVARFFWNLHCTKKNLNPGIYSQAFGGTKNSPVPDVPIDSSDFDAVLGCVENELMNLTDGINFAPEETVSGLDYLELLKKL
ncbi:MAG: hypothetical protein J6B81_04055 [Spirochaetaceae bacterium]|nr:hypothetical protein [Spirochaetaceae bacterium]